MMYNYDAEAYTKQSNQTTEIHSLSPSLFVREMTN